jgi:DNA replication protein DnaC
VGKTTLLEVIRRFGKLVRPKDDNGWDYSFSTQAAGDIIRQYRKFGESGIEEIINSHRLAIDDLGEETEPVVRFGEPVNVLQEVLSRRYDRRFGSFTHVTTNCSREQIIAIYGERVFDRAKEMFNFVRLSGKTRRKN